MRELFPYQLTVGDLREKLADYADDWVVTIAVNGSPVFLSRIKTKGKRFSVIECHEIEEFPIRSEFPRRKA